MGLVFLLGCILRRSESAGCNVDKAPFPKNVHQNANLLLLETVWGHLPAHCFPSGESLLQTAKKHPDFGRPFLQCSPETWPSMPQQPMLVLCESHWSKEGWIAEQVPPRHCLSKAYWGCFSRHLWNEMRIACGALLSTNKMPPHVRACGSGLCWCFVKISLTPQRLVAAIVCNYLLHFAISNQAPEKPPRLWQIPTSRLINPL